MWLGDSALFVSAEVLANQHYVPNSQVVAYDPATGNETTMEGNLDNELAAAETAAHDAGFDGLVDLLHKLNTPDPQMEMTNSSSAATGEHSWETLWLTLIVPLVDCGCARALAWRAARES